MVSHVLVATVGSSYERWLLLHGCVALMSMPRTALEPLDSSWQPARFVVLDDRRLQVNRVDHRSLAGCSLHNLGSGQ
eukprot:scaffold26066_cov102-Phaeocystis_antarctica.AAC.2